MVSVEVLRVHMFVGAVMCVPLSGWLIFGCLRMDVF